VPSGEIYEPTTNVVPDAPDAIARSIAVRQLQVVSAR
jgi:hypothetical protein